MAKETALTTIDNPYSPFSQYDEWYNYDLEKGYDCCGYIDRMSFGRLDSDSLSEEDEDQITESIIDEIVTTDPTGLFVKVEKVNNKTNETNDEKDFKLSKPFSEK